MCGIAGVWNLSSKAPVDIELLTRMAASLRHRGPDDSGVHTDGDLGLVNTRLSIVDVAGGHQPMSNEEGNLWVSFNGEIYNHTELRERLIQQGHTFRTRSDTEVILHLYEEDGPGCVESMNGQFAFALWDSGRRELFLARDRFGVRPLFYARHGGRFLFGSEIKSLLCDPDLPREIDPFALDQIFTFWFPIAPRTGFRGIEELRPGHVMRVTESGIDTRQYWALTFPNWEGPKTTSRQAEETYSGRLMELLDDAVRIRLRADVPVGAYLSGGLDSSVVASLARRRTSGNLHSFSIGFQDAVYDEARFQSEVALHLGTVHHGFLCRNQEIGMALPQAVWHAERPVLRTAPVPMMLLAKCVHGEGVKVVLTGEGADEVLAGYDIFKEAKVRRFWARAPRSERRRLLLKRLYPYLGDLKASSSYLAAFFGVDLESTADPFYSHRPRWRTTMMLKQLYSDRLREQLTGYDPVEELKAQLPRELEHWHPLSQAQYLECAFLLPGYILSAQGDRMAMAHAVEGRFPFLDHRVAEFASTIPPNLKLKGLREKYILRRGARHLLPEAVLRREKQPYRAPDHGAIFQNGAAPEYAEDLLSPAAVAKAGILKERHVAGLVAKSRRQESLGVRDSMALIGSLSVQLVYQKFINGD